MELKLYGNPAQIEGPGIAPVEPSVFEHLPLSKQFHVKTSHADVTEITGETGCALPDRTLSAFQTIEQSETGTKIACVILPHLTVG